MSSQGARPAVSSWPASQLQNSIMTWPTQGQNAVQSGGMQYSAAPSTIRSPSKGGLSAAFQAAAAAPPTTSKADMSSGKQLC